MDIDEDPHSVHVTIRGPVAEAAQVRPWITARAGRTACAVNDDPEHPGWTIAHLVILAPGE